MKRWTRVLLSVALLTVCACLICRAYRREPLLYSAAGAITAR